MENCTSFSPAQGNGNVPSACSFQGLDFYVNKLKIELAAASCS